MKKKTGRILVVAAATLAIAAGIVVAADTYKVDGVHSSAMFKIRHLGVSNVIGRFNDISGTITADKKKPESSSVKITIKTASVDTNNDTRDNHLRSPDFLDSRKYPTMSFKSTKVRKLSATKYEVTGDFTLHGVTKTIRVKVDFLGEGKGMKGETRAGFETSFTIKRSDYGMKKDIPMVGDEVQITLSVEAIGK